MDEQEAIELLDTSRVFEDETLFCAGTIEHRGKHYVYGFFTTDSSDLGPIQQELHDLVNKR